MGSEYEDEYCCPWCGGDIDLEKTKLDIIIRKFDINNALIKCNSINENQSTLIKQMAEVIEIYRTGLVALEKYGPNELCFAIEQLKKGNKLEKEMVRDE